MILLHLSKKNFNLIGKGACYSSVISCILDVPSLKSTNLSYQLFAHRIETQQVVIICSLYQFKVFL